MELHPVDWHQKQMSSAASAPVWLGAGQRMCKQDSPGVSHQEAYPEKGMKSWAYSALEEAMSAMPHTLQCTCQVSI